MERQTLPPRTLRFKLLSFAAALVVLPSTIFSVITYTNSRNVLEQVIGRHLAREASTAAKRLTATLMVERDALRSAAQQDLMRDLRVGDIDKRVSTFLATLKAAHPSCMDLAVIDSSRRLIAASDPALIDAWPSWAGRALESLRGADLMLGPIVAARASRRLPVERRAVLFATTVYDPDAPGAVIGVLVGTYDWEALTSVTREVRDDLSALGLHVDVLITDEDGAVIRRAAGLASSGQEEAEASSLELAGLEGSAAEPSSGFSVRSEAGLLIGRGRLGADLPAWNVLIVEPLKTALAPVDRMARRLALAVAVTLAVALGVAAVGAGRAVSAIRELTEAIRSLGRTGGSVDRVPIRARDEVGVLAHEFNRMASDLDRARQELVEAAKFAFVGELAAGIAHEIRTPLGVLRTSAQILERSLPQEQDADTTELVQMMRAEVDRVDGVVTELLHLARPRHAQLEPIPLAVPVFRAADFVEPQAREKGITIARSAWRERTLVLCDPELIYQVALNLLVNAIQVLPAGGRIDVLILPRADGVCAFEIRDNGPGIPDDVRHRIFLPFVAHREGGTGLGLTFVQRVVQEHQGRIILETEVGTGTSFRVELPIAEKPQ